MVKRSEPYVSSSNASSKAAAWLAEVRSAVRPRPRLTLDPQRAALLVVDMVNYFAAPGGDAYLPASAAALRQLVRLIPAWRAAGGTVIFTRHGHDGPQDTGMLGHFFSTYITWGTTESELVPELEPAESERVIRKRTYDAFHETELQQVLAAHKCEQILIGGVLTHMCCATTARSAFVRGFATHLLADGTATTTEALHLAALHTLADSVAILHSTREVLLQCQST